MECLRVLLVRCSTRRPVKSQELRGESGQAAWEAAVAALSGIGERKIENLDLYVIIQSDWCIFDLDGPPASASLSSAYLHTAPVPSPPRPSPCRYG